MDKNRQLQLTQLYILNKVSDICKKKSLSYYLFYGTLLGAIRHKGFIPWDDDIDIAMKRTDYNKFLKIAQDELGEEFFVQHHTTDPNYTRTIIKVRLNNTKHIEAEFEGININQGIYIDIFPLDISDDFIMKQKIKKQIINMLNRILSTKKNINVIDSPIKKIIKKIIAPATLMIPDKMIHYLYDYIATYDKNGTFLSSFFGAYNINKDTFLTNYFEDEVLVEFEGYNHAIPSNYHNILSNLYGDYMKIPKKEDQNTHNIVAVDFGKYENIIGDLNE